MSAAVQTVRGPVSTDLLGTTLMHEHLFVEFGGASRRFLEPGPQRDEITEACSGLIAEIRRFGVESLADPTTVDLGRNIPVMADIAAETGFTIICCTGIYSTAYYRRIRDELGSPEAVSDLFVRELAEGIDGTGIKAGFIKVVTGQPSVTETERELLRMAGRAAAQAGAPVMTHTEGVLGDEQQRILTAEGVPAHRIMIGHSCIATDFDYHERILQAGSYLGFDRFGMEFDMPDDARAASLVKLIQAGYADRMLLSHDSVWYWVGGPQVGSGPSKNWTPTNLFRRIRPMLSYAGVTDEQFEALFRDNPRRFFAGDRPA
jgi:phosphotriesterase-related protein